jgi:predicted ATPase with chaperone activity
MALMQQDQPKSDQDYNRQLSVLMERIDKLVEDATAEVLEKGSVSEGKIKLGENLLNQFTYAFKIVYKEYIGGKRGFTDELDRAQAFLKDVASAKEVAGGWLIKAAHRRMLPKLQAVVASMLFEPGWHACDGSEQDCLTCQILRKRK